MLHVALNWQPMFFFFFFPERFPVLDQGVQEHLKDAVAGTLKLKRLLSALDARGQGTLLLITRSY